MKAKLLPEPKTYPSLSGHRCEYSVESTSTGDWSCKQSQCCRVARYDIDGIKLCKQHAGLAALNYVLTTQT